MKDSRLFKLLLWLFILALLSISNSTFAALLMPIGVDDLYIYDKHNSEKSWVYAMQGLKIVDKGGIEYINIASWEEFTPGVKSNYEEGLGRSTETAVYFENGDILFQIAPIGTTWNYSSSHGSLGTGEIVNKITSIESVTVPYGTFNNAYVHEVYFDPDDPLLDNSPYWYEYVVPGVGWVKQVDYWTPGTAVLELRDITTVPIPASIWLLGSGVMVFASRRKRTGINSHK